jgi:carboxylesterase type B
MLIKCLFLGNFFKGIKTLAISHVIDESTLFTVRNVSTDTEALAYMKLIFPSSNYGVITNLTGFYPPVDGPFPNAGKPGVGKYSKEIDRIKDVVRDMAFTCNTRFIAEAYAEKSYMMEHSLKPGLHGTDINSFIHKGGNKGGNDSSTDQIRSAWQTYMLSLAKTGNPNLERTYSVDPPTIEWPLPDTSGQMVANTLNVTNDGYTLVHDDQNLKNRCDCWLYYQYTSSKVDGALAPGMDTPLGSCSL